MKETALIIHFIGLAMGLGTSFAFAFLGHAASKLEKEEGLKFSVRILALGKMGHIGLALLILSGIYLILPYHQVLSEMPLLITKLVLVAILGAVIGMISKNARLAAAGNPEKHLKKIEGLGKFSMLLGLSIVVLAVLQFK